MIRWAAARPAVAWALAFGLLGAGAVAFTKLPLATKDAVETARLTISAGWSGASPEVMETWVTSPIVGVVQGVPGIGETSSISNSGSASITLQLRPDADIPLTRLAVLERIEAMREELPEAARQSVRLSDYIPDDARDQPLLQVEITGSLTPGALQQVANDKLVPTLSALAGIGDVSINGGANNGLAVTFDPDLLRSLRINSSAIVAAIRNSRLVEQLGAIDNGVTVVPVTMRDLPLAIEDIGRLPISAPGGRVFQIRDLATIHPEEDDRGNFYRINGRTAVSLSLSRLPLADAIQTAALARRALDSLKTTLPASVRLRILSDDSVYLSDQLRDLTLRGAIAFVAVLLVLLVGTRNVGGSLVILGSAAVAIAGTSLGLFLLHIPANLLTLAGLAMGIGVLVQNGLVVVDRLQHVPDTGEARATAAIRITPAVLGSSLTTVVVLIPFLYLQGNARATFVPFAAAFALALFWSIGTALVLVPAVARSGLVPKTWPRLARVNRAMVRGLFRWRLLTQLATLAVLGVLTWAFVKKIPRTDWSNWGSGQRRTSITASVSFPRGYDPAQVEALVRELEQVALRQPGGALVTTRGNPSSGSVTLTFPPETSDGEEPWIASDALTQRAVLIGGTEAVSVSKPEGTGFYGGSGGSEMISKRFRILGYSFRGVRDIAMDLRDRLALNTRIPLAGININLGDYRSGSSSTVLLVPDRMALGRLGATTEDYNNSVASEVRTDPGGSASVLIDGVSLPVTVKSSGTEVRQLDALGEGMLQNPGGAPTRIRDVSTIEEIKELARIERVNQRYIRTMGYDFRGPAKLADRKHKAFMASISVPPGFTVEDDTGRWYSEESAKALGKVFALGVVLVLLSVAMVYNSVWASAMVFLSLPISLGGVVAAFWITGTAFTREAAVGVILVVGLAVNHSILLIDAAMVARRTNRRVTAAGMFRATLDRSEMILLVTLTTIASLIPMSYGTDSKDTFGAIAIATAGGVLASAVGAMFIFPPIIVGWSGLPWRKWFRRRKKTALPAPADDDMEAPLP